MKLRKKTKTRTLIAESDIDGNVRITSVRRVKGEGPRKVYIGSWGKRDQLLAYRDFERAILNVGRGMGGMSALAFSIAELLEKFGRRWA